MRVIRDALPTDARVLAEISIDGWRTAYVGIVPDEVIARRPSIPLSVFAREEALGQLQEAFQWVMDEIKAS